MSGLSARFWSKVDIQLEEELPCDVIAQDVLAFCRTTRLRQAWRWCDVDDAITADLATLRALAHAYQETQP